jgi:UDPglucose--hexose-1-phosphate uridylyltransferase
MVPKNVQEELAGSKRYFELRERCIFCDIYTQEQEARIRVIQETEHFVAFCPFVSRFSFEMWILPRQHQSCFIKLEQNPDQILDLARVLRESLLRLRNLLFDPAFNFIIHTSPLDKEEEESYHWHIEIMPRLTRVAGFEWGTGFYVVSTPPELAAHLLNTEGLENNNTKDR